MHAAYSSGHPALGVGSGNTPAIIDETADVEMAVSSIILSKTFDNGVICASEQSAVVVDAVYDKVRAEFEKRGAYFLTPAETESAGKKIILPGNKLNVDIVGQSVEKLAALFGIKAPNGTRVLIGEVARIGAEEPWAYEKLSPLLGMYRAKDLPDAVDKAAALVDFAGAGHTSVLYTSPQNKAAIRLFESKVNTCRMLINSPAAQGGIGDVFNFHLDPSLTLGCGSWGDNSVSTNVTPANLLNIKTVASRRENMCVRLPFAPRAVALTCLRPALRNCRLWFRVPPKIYFKGGSMELGLKEMKGKKRAFIVTDKPLFDIGVTHAVTKTLESVGVEHNIFYDGARPAHAARLHPLRRTLTRARAAALCQWSPIPRWPPCARASRRCSCSSRTSSSPSAAAAPWTPPRSCGSSTRFRVRAPMLTPLVA
jgi:acetaldehyde dehydrogenase/alcohol dehydrogenase